MLPGVGTFGATMAGLREAGLDAAIAERARGGTPILAMCVGLQVLFEASDESPGEGPRRAVRQGRALSGDGAGAAVRLEPDRAGARLPLSRAGLCLFRQQLSRARGAGLQGRDAPEHGETFVAALERGPLLACQFHPELSGAFGHRLIARWLEG